MLSKQQQKYIQSLHLKKYRTEYNQFLVEGKKNLLELLTSNFKISQLFVTSAFLNSILNENLTLKIEVISEEELRKISTLHSNDAGLAVVEMQPNGFNFNENSDLILALDNINDPGNLGTIIRIADWYRVKSVICSENTVEFYNPKVIMATMGSFTRVQPFYTNLNEFLQKSTVPTWGAFLDGKNIHQFNETIKGILVIGSESHGISASIAALIKNKITIPKFGDAESLNAGIATAILIDNITRLNSH